MLGDSGMSGWLVLGAGVVDWLGCLCSPQVMPNFSPIAVLPINEAIKGPSVASLSLFCVCLCLCHFPASFSSLSPSSPHPFSL